MKARQLFAPLVLLASTLGLLGCAPQARSADQSAVHREGIEWSDIWITDGGETNLPRVLLIGDSITRMYYPQVADKLSGKASVSRLSTSKSVGDDMLLKEVALVLQEYHWDVIHFNNGLHGWDYSEDEFRRAYPKFIATIQKYAPRAKLICATSTSVYADSSLTQLSPKTQRVIERNKIAVAAATAKQIPIDDIFALTEGHSEYWSGDTVHPSDKGVAAESAQVANSIAPLLSK
ncbi:MAG: hypothetical protein JWQ02_4184 [Capsulimonas sp.]|jgi:hypothetical protein|nr:hypothetical protein [Capsulimonas sp.]